MQDRNLDRRMEWTDRKCVKHLTVLMPRWCLPERSAPPQQVVCNLHCYQACMLYEALPVSSQDCDGNYLTPFSFSHISLAAI